MSARWGAAAERRTPALLENTHPALTLALVLVLLALAAMLAAGVAG